MFIEWSMAESIDPEAFLEDLVDWRHKQGCSLELLVFMKLLFMIWLSLKYTSNEEKSDV